MSVFRVRLSQGDSRTGTGNLDSISRLTGTITDATNASPIVITSASHGLVTGTRVTVQSVGGNTAANNDYVITVLSSSTFSLNGSTGNAAYTSGGVWKVDSAQRTIYAMGPNKINRKLKDGERFTDCNYWKRFAYPQVPYNEAFIEVVTDDGSVYIDGQPSSFVRTYTESVTAGTDFDDGYTDVDIYGDNSGYATWAIITPDVTIQVQVNGVETSQFSITGGTSYTFNVGEILLSSLQLARSASSGTATVTVQLGITTQCSS
jgi:hypothetical protein